jgi:hypothetical protein
VARRRRDALKESVGSEVDVVHGGADVVGVPEQPVQSASFPLRAPVAVLRPPNHPLSGSQSRSGEVPVPHTPGRPSSRPGHFKIATLS